MSSITRVDWHLQGPEGRSIHGQTDVAGAPIDRQAVIVHGYTGSKDRNIIPALGYGLACRGITCHRFTMTHAGIEPGADEVTDTDAFENDSTQLCLDNIECVINALKDGQLPSHADAPYTLVGHSRGGATALGFAGRMHNTNLAPDGVISVAGLGVFWRYDHEVEQQLQTHGFVKRQFGRTAAGYVRLGPSWYAHEREEPRLAFDDVLASIRTPVLLIHGDADANVGLEHPQRVAEIVRQSGGHVQMHIVSGGDHNLCALGFGVDHDNIQAQPASTAVEHIATFMSSLPAN